eukprot:296490-Prymnesium_polylepis.1
MTTHAPARSGAGAGPNRPPPPPWAATASVHSPHLVPQAFWSQDWPSEGNRRAAQDSAVVMETLVRDDHDAV